jgi:NADH-quinone oxidoreductase subunit G
LRGAKNPVILSGVHSGSEEIINACENIVSALSASGNMPNLSFVLPECNSLGSAMIGGKSLDEALANVQSGDTDTVIVLENDLYLRADLNGIDKFFDKCKQVVVLDHLPNKTTLKADILIPVGTFAESTGTLVNNEGRAQRFYAALPHKFPVLDSWKWIRYLEEIIHDKESSKKSDFEGLLKLMSEAVPVFKNIKNLNTDNSSILLNEKISRQTRRFSGRTAIHANVNVSEQPPPGDDDSPLAFTMEGRNETPPSSLVTFYWSPGWNSVQALYKYTDEPNGSLKGGDPGIRLIEKNDRNGLQYFTQIPPPFAPKTDEMFIVPTHHIFGSEELSSKCNAIGQRIPVSTIYMNNSDAGKIGVISGDMVSLDLLEDQFIIVKINESLPEGIAGLFCRHSDVSFIELYRWGKVFKQQIK